MSEARVEVPDIGDATDVDVVEVLVKPGMRVERDQSLIVLESDKASMEVPAPFAGTIKSVALGVGDKVSKGALILMLDTDGLGTAAQPAAAQRVAVEPPKAAAPPSTRAKVAEPAPIHEAPPQSARALPRVEEPAEEEPAQDSGEEGGDVGATAASALKAEAAAPARAEPPRAATRTIPPPDYGRMTPEPPQAADKKQPHATPSVRRFARELGVDLMHVPGTGPHERISQEDVQRYVKTAMSHAGTATGTGFAFPELPEIDFKQFGDVATQPLTKIQKLSGRNLLRSWVTIPHVTQFDEADITELEEFRKKMRAERPEAKLTLTSFFMKAVVVMLKQMPRFNSSLDKSGENLVMKQYFHLGVAVDTPNGLVVPVIRDVDLKGLHDLATELAAVSERARARRLAPQDLQGACMTISSLGGIGGTHFTPIINPPEVAVLGVSRAMLKPGYVNGQLMPRLTCGLSLSYDHRVIDGADAVRFTTRLREVLSDIRQMLL
jgi:pyruvate dehydrogenase E2 component (dihydrolipoamide acetyltransferase)